MTRRFGDRGTFAVEIGDVLSPDLRTVDVWAAGTQLTKDDNAAYVPSLRWAMRSTAAQVRRRDLPACPYPGRSPEAVFQLLEQDGTEFRERFWFLPWGETLDTVSRYAYLDGDLVLVFSFWRPTRPVPDDPGAIVVATLAPDEFATTVLAAADLLDAESVR
ncbi:hypothetical protein DDE19_14060 [Micromonospora ureilytica]|uniref:Uncharacterized protein n=1 Tax=Micromonospora ureilytica TaxID=709868 RepID=A0A3N9YBB4_9ACTN|nr:hypothetical protein [Micromonospora ureilytica]RQX16697.1 hypothetical protein DDE19_14060 [Micromonospora ureilytica]